VTEKTQLRVKRLKNQCQPSKIVKPLPSKSRTNQVDKSEKELTFSYKDSEFQLFSRTNEKGNREREKKKTMVMFVLISFETLFFFENKKMC